MTELEFELEFKKRKLQKRKQRRMELLIIGAHLGVVLVLLYWMFGIGMVHGRSMRPAYRDGDLFLYQRRLFREPDYGDVVVIHRQDLERDIVKRIAGKPGDVIDLDDLGHLTRNGERAAETEILFGEQDRDGVQNVTFAIFFNKTVISNNKTIRFFLKYKHIFAYL